MFNRIMQKIRLRQDAIWTYGGGLFLFIVILLPRVLPFPAYFVTFDETTINTWSNEMVSALFSGRWADTANNAYPAVTIMWIDAVRIGIQSLGNFLAGDTLNPLTGLGSSPMLEVAARRFIFGVINSLLVLGMYAALRSLFGRWPAFLAALLIAFDPFFLTQSRVGRVEALAAGFMLVSVLLLLLSLNQKSRRLWLVGSGFFAGLAGLTKVTSLILAPFAGVMLFAWPLLTTSESPKSLIAPAFRSFLGWGLVVFITTVLFWPALWVAPVATGQLMYNYLQDTAAGVGLIWGTRGVFFRGDLVKGDPGWLFYPLTLAFRTTPLVWGGLIFGLFWMSRRIATWIRSLLARRVSDRLLAVLGLGFFTTLFLIGMSLGASKVDRYLIPIFPPLDILAGLGISLAVGYFASLQNGKMWQGIALVFVVTLQLAMITPHHPYYFTYWNPLMGGGTRAVETLPVGAGEGLDTAIEYLDHHHNTKDLTLVCQMYDLCNDVFDGEVWGDYRSPIGGWLTADYALIYIVGLQREEYPDFVLEYLVHLTPVQVFSKDKVDYAWLYKMPKPEYYVGQKIDGYGTLIGYHLPVRPVTAGTSLKIPVYWQNDEYLKALDFSPVLVELVDRKGYVRTHSLTTPRLDFSDEITRPQAIIEQVADLSIPITLPPDRYILRMSLWLPEFNTRLDTFSLPDSGDSLLIERGVAPTASEVEMDQSLHLTFDDSGLTLLGYKRNQAQVTGAFRSASHFEISQLDFYWQVEDVLRADYALLVQILDDQNRPLISWLDTLALPGQVLGEVWQPGDLFVTPWTLAANRELSTGQYQLAMTLLDTKTLKTVAKGNIDNFSIEKGDHFKPNFTRQGIVGPLGGDGLDLVGYDLMAKQEGRGGILYLTLHWLATNRIFDQPVSVQLLSDQDAILVEHSAKPIYLLGEYPWERVTYHSFRLNELTSTKLRLSISVQGAHPMVIDDVLGKAVIELN